MTEEVPKYLAAETEITIKNNTEISKDKETVIIRCLK